ncbi:hypothetical protein MPL3365_130536 [Mesorhizobium plurifarium]|uniref:Uncharacterized protein n=1 Tax=Mesorhizobium plurifarium TaxID=69974 RepID=A0A090G3R6_MESPL|nr:hypothetical protein MPL3365_130536 [Mesorhizobium plurifarium]
MCWRQQAAVLLAAWGPEGHAVVAMLAEAKLSPEAKSKIRNILFGAPLVTGAIMADDIRISRPETARWHFVEHGTSRGILMRLAGATCQKRIGVPGVRS